MRGRKRGAAREEEVVAFIIPTDIFEEILHRLPSNDLLKFKVVCKEWRGLISSHRFIQKHLERSESHDPRMVTSQYLSEMEILSYCAKYLNTKKIHGKGHVSLLGSCDGLVLYIDDPDFKIGALNPATGKTEVGARLSKASIKNEMLLQNFFACTWFGRHPATDEYILVIAFLKTEEYKSIVFKVYGLSRDSLLSSLTEELDCAYSFCCRDIGTFLHGRLHFTAVNHDSSGDRKTDILAYDLMANKMLIMWAPLEYCPALGVVDVCLCALNSSELWIMKEYGVKESWTKYANLDDKISILNGYFILCDDFLKAIRDGATELLNGKGVFMKRRIVACIDSLVSPAVVWEKRE